MSQLSRGLSRAVGWSVAMVAVTAGCREREIKPDAGTTATAAPSQTRVLYPNAPGAFVDLVSSARPSVVAIRSAAPVKAGPASMFPGAPESAADVALGTGFVIESKGTFVLTNDHIAAASSELRVVWPDGTELPAKLVGRDNRLDLALLSIDGPAAPAPSGSAAGSAAPAVMPSARLEPLRLGDSDDLHVGEWLVVLGNPFGDEVTASVGIVSSTGRDAAGSLVTGPAVGFRTFIQTDARIHRGNSGGPVIDSAGEVVGVAIATGDRPGELSFAIPSNRVREVIDALRDHGQVARSWLGAVVKPVTPELARANLLAKPSGALVTEVKPGSPASRAGLRAGDIVIRWGDRDVDHRSLPWIVQSTPAGKTVNVLAWRNKAALPIPVITEAMPE
ncbi:MAG: S1C family serine protease [Kofleriaceae bacterium]